ncbi:MAG TPA: hybrid sensor histidine kinase/response regulator, partial [Nannocystaceae bacterium]|nr:hybrid sensor histidine kinase/response regulator [Nannocystaceae bacterium]
KRVLDVRECIQQAHDVLRAQVQLHEVVLDLPGTPLLVRADETRLRQIVVHLLDNASRFTPRGGRIVITAREDQGSARITIRDSGIGIASDRLDELFGAVTRDSSNEDTPGVGLVLVRRLVELHGGTITAWSDAERGGTEVAVALPLATATEVRRPSDVLPRANLRLLVVDDNVDAAETLGILLEAQGHVVTLAFDGASALELAGRGKHDAVLLDLGLPDLDGLEIARHIKATAPAIHLIAVTGYGDEHHRAHARAAGIAQHLLKPVERDALRRALAEVRPRESVASS